MAEQVTVKVNEAVLTSLTELRDRLNAAIDSAWTIAGSGQLGITVTFGYNWKFSDGVKEFNYSSRHTLSNPSTVALKNMISTMLTAETAALALHTFGVFENAIGYAVISVEYNN